MHFAKLTERDLDTRIADKLLAAGCDQQGREATREWVPMDYRPGWYVQAAEAAKKSARMATGTRRSPSPALR